MSVIVAFGMALPAAASGPWEGTWDTTYGQVRLRQDGWRVWGDYVDQRGVIEARTSADGLTLRGTFVRGDQRWGWLTFTMAGAGWQGRWRWNDLPQPGDTAWNARARRHPAPPLLQFATGPGPFWPPTYAGSPSGRYALYAFGPGGQDPHSGGTPPPAAQRPIWFGGYDSDLFASGYTVSLSIDDTGRPSLLDLSFFAPAGTAQDGAARCPAAMHPQFCAEIHARFSPDTSTRASLSVTLLGARIEARRVMVAFALSGDPAARLLVLTREGTGGGDLRERIAVYHPQRGLDLESAAILLPHPCDGSPCEARPGMPPGPLVDPGFPHGFLVLPDRRAAAHGMVRSATPPPLPALARGERQIVDQNGQELGVLSLEQDVNGLVFGTGRLIPSRALQGSVPRVVRASALHVTPEAVDLQLTYGTGPALPPARLLLGPQPGGEALTGTLLRGEEWDLVTLVAPEEDEVFDLPGVGVYGPSYRLRNHGGNPVLLRSEPRSGAAGQGGIAAFVSDINVLQCRPEVDSLMWEQSTLTTRRQVLDGIWCEVQQGRARSCWIPGHFLDPIPQ